MISFVLNGKKTLLLLVYLNNKKKIKNFKKDNFF